MGNIICYCAHCKTKLDVDESWSGKELQCPVCEKTIAIPYNETNGSKDLQQPQAPAENARKTATTASNFFTRKYLWGRIGAASGKVLALLSIVAGVIFSIMQIADYSLALENIPEYQELEAAGQALTKQEKQLQKSFAGAELRLYGTNGSGNLDTSGVFGGINFPQESAMLPGVMPLSLFSQRDRTRAENILKDYQKKLQVIRKAFIASFGQYFAPEIENSTTVQNFTSSRIVIRTGGEKFSFYNDENRKAAELNQLFYTLDQLKKDKNISRNNLADIHRAEAVGKFIKQQLFSLAQHETVVHGSSRNSSGSFSGTPAAINANRKNAMHFIQMLAHDWQLEKIITQMDLTLQKSQIAGKIYTRKQSQLRQKLFKELFSLWVKVIMAAFVLAVFSDYLKAHFDGTELLSKIAEQRNDEAI